MTDLLEWAIADHGGLDRWNTLRTVSLDLSVGGALWDSKGQTGLFANASYEADIHRQRATLGRFGAPDRCVQFAPDRLVLETERGDVLEIRDNPRAAFAGHTSETPWDQLHAAYFDGYALWTYLTQPFLYQYPGFLATEIEPWKEDGGVWRRLKVRFPDSIGELFRARWAAAAARLCRRCSWRCQGRPLHRRLSRARRHHGAIPPAGLSSRRRQSQDPGARAHYDRHCPPRFRTGVSECLEGDPDESRNSR